MIRILQYAVVCFTVEMYAYYPREICYICLLHHPALRLYGTYDMRTRDWLGMYVQYHHAV